MTANNCDDVFKQLQELQQDKQKLQDELQDMERQLAAAGIRRQPPATEGGVVLPGRDGRPRELSGKDIEQGYKQLVSTLSSTEVDELVDRGFEILARPVGSEGRFQNYDRILREVDVSTMEDYARLAEALGITRERIAPEDYHFITQKYGRERLLSVVETYYRELGASDAELLAKAAVKTAPFINAVENKTWLRFMADRTLRMYLDSAEAITDFMRAAPNFDVPDALKQEAFRNYKLALVLTRHDSLANRRVAQALRSQQEEILGLEQFQLDLGDEGEEKLREAIGMTAKDLDKDEHFSRVLQAIDDNDVTQLDLVIDTAKMDGLDPKSSLKKDWFNTHMRMATALVKDSQLGNLQTQALNAESNTAMFFFGPLQQTVYNGFRLTPVATSLTRGPLLEAAEITSGAFRYALDTFRATWKRDLQRVFQTGVSHYSGNLDTYGKNLLTNKQELDDMQAILDMPYQQTRGKYTQLLHPYNHAIFTNKLQAAARILALTKPSGTAKTGMSRIEAAWAALGIDRGQGVQRIRAQDIDMYVPWKPFLRGMAVIDEVSGKFQYLFKLKADLEVKARLEGAQLGLFDNKDRAAWVQQQLDDAIYQATPSENDIKAFRKQHGIKGSDMTDDQIAEHLAEQNLEGAATLATQESINALDYSAGMRFQNAPKEGFGKLADTSMMGLRKNWLVDRYLMPYWRSPWMGMLFDHRLATFAIWDTARVFGGKDPSPELVARTKAAWAMSGAVLGVFGMLDAAGHVRGSTDSDVSKRNTLFGIRLAGVPVLNTLFLWKDILETGKASISNEYDGQELATAWMKVMTGHIMRQTGIAQIQLLTDAMLDGTQRGGEKLRKLVAFMGSGQIPFIGAERNLERATGTDRNSFYRDAPDTAQQQYLLGKDDPLAKIEQSLRELAYDSMPAVAAFTQGQRKLTDHLGTPIGHINGVDLSRAIPFFPVAWPKGKVNEVVYGELDAQDMLDPPPALLSRTLNGVAMSDQLQQEYNGIIGSIKGDPKLPPSARLNLAGKTLQVRISMPVETVTAQGVRIRKDGGASLPLAQILDKATKGRTRKEALYALFTSPQYQQFEDDPSTMANPPGGLPKPMRRQRVAQKLIRGITDYYDLLTQDELERRAADGRSQAAKEYSQALTGMSRAAMEQGLEQIKPTARILSSPASPAE